MADGDIDKDKLYGKFEAGEERRQKLGLKAAYKALDMTRDDEMNIDASRVSNGLGTLGTLGVAMAAGLPSMALAAWMFLHREPAAPAQTATPVAVCPTPESIERDLVIRFWTCDGKPIDIPHISERPK